MPISAWSTRPCARLFEETGLLVQPTHLMATVALWPVHDPNGAQADWMASLFSCPMRHEKLGAREGEAGGCVRFKPGAAPDLAARRLVGAAARPARDLQDPPPGPSREQVPAPHQRLEDIDAPLIEKR